MDNSSLAIFVGVAAGIGLCVTDYYQLHPQNYNNLSKKLNSINPDPELKVLRLIGLLVPLLSPRAVIG